MTSAGQSTHLIESRGVPVERIPVGMTSAEAKLIYLYICHSGGCTAEEVAESLRLTKLSAFPHLRRLADRGFLDREAGQYLPADGHPNSTRASD